jgi:cytochrome c oxidase subunit 1
MATGNAAEAHGEHATPTGWRRWLFSTNHKDIGTLYLFFAVFAGIIGATFSILMRIELMYPGMQFLPMLTNGDIDKSYQLFNTLITAHDDRGAGYGFPAHEQRQFLAVAAVAFVASGLGFR